MSNHWALAATLPNLPANELQVWRLDATSIAPALLDRGLERLLSPEEKVRAARIHSTLARTEFIAARLLLRLLLGNLVGTAPQSLTFAFNHNEKPHLAGEPGLAFNLAHSHGLVLIALTRIGAVGVDLEFLDHRFAASEEMLAIARQSFSADDLRSIEQATSAPLRSLRFYACWTAREALAKAEGRGIATRFTYTPIGTDDDGNVQIAFTREKDQATTEYFLRPLPVGEHFCAAVAASQPGLQLACFDAAPLFTTPALFTEPGLAAHAP